MGRVVQLIPPGAVLVDAITRINAATAHALKADGVAGVIQYLGKLPGGDPGLTSQSVDAIMDAGLGLFCVCYADNFDGAYRALLAVNAGVLPGTTIATDLESYHRPAADCIQSLNTCAQAIETAGYLPCLYVGSDQPLSADQLGALRFRRYWKSASNVQMPTYNGVPRGWSLVQHLGDPRNPNVDWRRVMRGGINVDLNFANPDALGRSLTWMIEAA